MKNKKFLFIIFSTMFIQPCVGYAVTGIPVKDTKIMSESFENNSWTSRGWYDGTNSTGVTSGGHSGNALKWTFRESDTRPAQFSVLRQSFTDTDEFLLEYYLKFDAGWRGSGKTYHPHFLHIISSEDSNYQGFARSNSNLYFEAVAKQSSPFINYPVIAHQDMYRTNSSAGNVPNNLITTTENRSANHCNTPSSLSGATGGNCYKSGDGWYSANLWNSATVNIPAATWTKITVHIKHNTFTNGVGNFDGIMKLWVEDTLAISSTNVLYAAGAYEGAKWDKVALAPYIGDGSPIVQTMWIDELSLWTVASDNITLTIPRNFSVD